MRHSTSQFFQVNSAQDPAAPGYAPEQVIAPDRSDSRHQATSRTTRSIPSAIGTGNWRDKRKSSHSSSTSSSSSRHSFSELASAHTPSNPGMEPYHPPSSNSSYLAPRKAARRYLESMILFYQMNKFLASRNRPPPYRNGLRTVTWPSRWPSEKSSVQSTEQPSSIALLRISASHQASLYRRCSCAAFRMSACAGQ